MSFYLAEETKDGWHHIKGHLYYLADSICYDLTLLFGKGNEPTEENDERIKSLLDANTSKYVSYDNKTLILKNLSWLKEK